MPLLVSLKVSHVRDLNVRRGMGANSLIVRGVPVVWW